MVKRAPPRKNRTPTKSAKRTKQETLAVARGKQTGVGVKAAKKRKKPRTRTKEESGDPPRSETEIRNKRRGRKLRRARTKGEEGDWKTTAKTVEGFSRFRREPGSPISNRYRYSTRRGKDRCMKLLLPISMLMRETYERMET